MLIFFSPIYSFSDTLKRIPLIIEEILLNLPPFGVNLKDKKLALSMATILQSIVDEDPNNDTVIGKLILPHFQVYFLVCDDHYGIVIFRVDFGFETLNFK